MALAHADHIDHDAHIVSQQSDILPDGQYQYSYETSNGIAAQEQGAGGVAANGNAKYVAPDGQVVQLSYTADANGFVAQGSHVPQIPEEILKSLEWNRAHPEEDDYLHPELSAGHAAPLAAAGPAYSAPQIVTIRPHAYTTARPYRH